MARRTTKEQSEETLPRRRPGRPRKAALPEKAGGHGPGQGGDERGALSGEILDGAPGEDEGEIDEAGAGDLDLELGQVADLPPLGDDDEDDLGPDGDVLGLDLTDRPPVGGGTGTGHSLVKADPLTAYMQEIRRYPLLSREEEHDLAVRFAKTRDPAIARRLITANLRLVVKIAHEYRRAYKNLLDLVQEGNLGLLQAVQKYDPHRGVKLSSYSAWWIRAYMLKFILNNWRLVKIGTTQAQRKLFFNLAKERDKLESAGFVPTSKLLAERLEVPEREVADMQLRLGGSEMSLDAPIGRDDEGGRTQVEMLESASETRPDVSTEGREMQMLLQTKFQEFAKTLSGREAALFHDRMLADQPLTLQEIGERYGISRERARQIEARITTRLRTFLRRELGETVQVAMGLED
jgi:RNA polymerase sigma-32 factor